MARPPEPRRSEALVSAPGVLQGSGDILASLLLLSEPSLGQPHLLLGVAPCPLPEETHTCTHLQACTHTHTCSHTPRCARPLVLHSELPGSAIPGCTSLSPSPGGCRPLTLPLCPLPSWELCVCVCVCVGCVCACVCLLTTRLVTLGDDVAPPPTSQGRDRRGVPLPIPRN